MDEQEACRLIDDLAHELDRMYELQKSYMPGLSAGKISELLIKAGNFVEKVQREREGKFPYFTTHSELRRLVRHAQTPHCRVGQAVCNKWRLPDDIRLDLYQDDDFSSVSDKLWKYFKREDYQ